MQICDFPSSFVSFTTKDYSNTARIQVESRCELIDLVNDSSKEFFLVASCKSERTYAESNLFQVPNYDFCGVFSAQDFLIIRAHASYEGNRNTTGTIESYFSNVHLHTMTTDRVQTLNENRGIVQATLNQQFLVGRTEITTENGRFRAILDYPIKTMNVNPERNIYQVDTGPIPFLDLASKESEVAQFKLAYVAYNTFNTAEFVIQQPTQVHPSVSVNHYSHIISMPAQNTIFAVGGV